MRRLHDVDTIHYVNGGLMRRREFVKIIII
jgi:hypothetical protein